MVERRRIGLQTFALRMRIRLPTENLRTLIYVRAADWRVRTKCRNRCIATIQG